MSKKCEKYEERNKTSKYLQNKPFASVTWAAAYMPKDTSELSNLVSKGFVKYVPSFKTTTPFGTYVPLFSSKTIS